MYAKCGSIDEASCVFDKLSTQDVVSWNVLMRGYLEHGLPDKVFDCFDKVNTAGIAVDQVTLLCCLNACCNVENLKEGHATYAAIMKHGLERELVLGNASIDMYTKCGALMEAKHVLDHMFVRDVISWTTLIAGYVENGCGEEALKCLKNMKHDGVSPNAATLVCSLKACSSTRSIDMGRKIQADIPETLYRSDPTIGNTLVDMFAKCGSLMEALQIFNELPKRTIVSWNALIAGYVEHGHGNDALNCFDQMQLDCMSPDASTLNCSLKACGLIRSSIKSQVVHSEIVKKGLEQSYLIGNTLVDVYVKCNLLADGRYVFDRQKVRNVISWTALISGYADRGVSRDALDCLEEMEVDGVVPNAVTMTCSLKACSNIGAIDVGQALHAQTVKRGILYTDYSDRFSKIGDKAFHELATEQLQLENALVDMYGKCGNVLDAHDVFGSMPMHDLVSWNALITGYSRQGHAEIVFELFDGMAEEAVHPDEITFLSILSVCSHAGLVQKARSYFKAMTEYNLSPKSEHYNCVIDLLGRAGQILEATEMLERMPYQPTIFAWCSMLGACRKWGNVKLGQHAFECVLRLDSQHAAAFMLMFSIYVDACMWEEAKKVEEALQALKQPGQSLVDIFGVVHTFCEEDVDNMRHKELHAKLREVYLEMEKRDSTNVLTKTSNSINCSCKHSERLALVYGLLNTSERSQIHIVKNVPICEDCHNVMTFISRTERRKIVFKDKICYHEFKNGKCSCGYYC
ncbi:hypothetical protein KP509_05G036100 [Ceratopteris richardii]|nr:hypothetical protein KP509_05G036100 [Ceratopteris richardii]